MIPSSPQPGQKRDEGFALIMVLFMTVLLTLLVVGMLIAARSELRSSDSYVATIRADQLAEIAKGAVVSQIRRGTQFDPEDGLAWASQPGALRAYGENGRFDRGFKLYSDSIMEVGGDEAALANDAPPTDWDGKPDHYVDLNAPVVRTGQEGALHTFFPILDPRAAYDDPDTDMDERIEGFAFREEVSTGGGSLAGVIGDDENPDKWRLPMPVEWLYVLRDGTIGALDEDGTFQPESAVTTENPIEGRIAFWTDDESSKINVNTASEPTYWAPPTIGDRYDWGWAKMQPATGEYQRFPGHPATTALSPVLLPNQRFADAASPDWNTGEVDREYLALARESAEEKGRIYDWAPKIQDIGSRSGSQLMHFQNVRRGMFRYDREIYYPDEFDPFASAKERLYASIDEYLLDPYRQEHDFSFTNFTEDAKGRGTVKGDSATLVNEERLRRSRPFLTAHSRAPETTVFGTPRIAMWPIHADPSGDEEAGYRTHFDRLIARCATIGPVADALGEEDNSYYFRRENSESSTQDIGLDRNVELLEYLQELTDRKVPGYGESLESKYGAERDQILVEMFDYVRSTNLFDPTLAQKTRDQDHTAEGDWKYRTYTEGRKRWAKNGEDNGVRLYAYWHKFEDGHGTVTPSYHEDWDAKGLGRAPTVSEVAMHFICCADGTPNDANEYKDDPSIANPWKGGPRSVNGRYSNFPPNPVGNPYGPRTAPDPHPGYNEENWNRQLEDNKPLPVGKKRIQGLLHVDLFNIAPGFNQMKGRFGFRVSGLRNLKVDGQTLFPRDVEEHWHTHGSPFADWDVSNGLQHVPDHQAESGGIGKRVRARHPVPDDVDPPTVHPASGHLNRWRNDPPRRPWIDLVTNFIDVDQNTMSFGASGSIEIDLIIQHQDDDPEEIVQTIVVDFPSPSSIPSPNLTLLGYGRWGAHPAEFYWSFYRDGFNNKGAAVWPTNPLRGGRMTHLGRRPQAFYLTHGGIRNTGDQYDVIYSMVPWHGDYRIIAGQRLVDKDANSPTGKVFVPARGVPSGTSQGMDFGHFSFDKTLPAYHNANLHSSLHPLPQLQTKDTLARLPWSTWYYTDGTGSKFPKTPEAMAVSRRYGDFDIGVGAEKGGPFINKPDEGNLLGAAKGTDNLGEVTNDRSYRLDIPYYSGNVDDPSDAAFSPNRMISSAAMMGSLPSGVKAQDPWRTLLFRPDSNSIDADGNPTTHPGALGLPDHLLLDLFWMPVVEPYAISEPFSTAGKVNLNYQMLPFSHIRRTTALHGLMKGERIPSLPVGGDDEGMGSRNGRDWNFSNLVGFNPAEVRAERYDRGRVHRDKVYRRIDIEETLEDFEKKFDVDDTLFRSASQLCEMHLVPEVVELPTGVLYDEGQFPNKSLDTKTRMEDYWKTHRGTPDNLRERPYANLYGRTTTQTNTWRIHYRVQRLKKPLGGNPAKFDTQSAGGGSVAGEQRGSLLLERFLDPNDPALPDFAKDPEKSLDSSYQFRVLNTRRFSL